MENTTGRTRDPLQRNYWDIHRKYRGHHFNWRRCKYSWHSVDLSGASRHRSSCGCCLRSTWHETQSTCLCYCVRSGVDSLGASFITSLHKKRKRSE
ncbi:hypothetical protein [Stenotrophomonas sp. DR009]|uniref:hypothetical protein n=1 Tax=Stenotrophomonas sp. DR009 TaxID=3398461 RepID=UPI003BAF06DD